jgi:alpha-beta hydrolase superfamily lysophospholipase
LSDRKTSVGPTEIRTEAFSKEAIHFGTAVSGGGHRLFGFYHPPKDPTAWRDVGVVLCAPIGTDHTRSDRTYRHLAERLSAAGFACLRFDLSYTGDSSGGELAPGVVRDWVSDIGAATDELRRRSGAHGMALVGLRWGATLAYVHAAERGDIDSLVLWSPCVSGAAFVAEVTKLHKLYARIEPQMAGAPPPRADGEEALGCFLPRAVVEELSQVDLLQNEGRPAKRTLVINGGSLPGQEALLERLRTLGSGPELRTHLGHKFLITVSHRSLVPDEPIDSIVGWLSEAHPQSQLPYTAPPLPTGFGPSGERPLRFGAAHPLFGILTPADPSKARRDRPPIVLANAGCVNRAGPHRIYTKMARRWAALGYDVLRVDLSGIGDSPAVPGERENLTYPASALADLGEATRALGCERFIIAGLCSGGDYAFQLGSQSASVAGAWLLNPRTFCVLDLAAVESGVPPTAPVDEVPRSLRKMADRGVDTLLVVSKNDPGVAYVDAHASDGMRSLSGVSGFERVDVEGSDHSFTPFAVQERLSDLLTGHLS